MRKLFTQPLQTRQRGISLLMALVLLTAVMLIVVMTYRLSSSQSQLAGNQQFQANALNEAERAISAAEIWLYNDGDVKGNRAHKNFLPGGRATGVTHSGLYAPGETIDINSANTWMGSDLSLQANGTDTSRYFIQFLTRRCKPGFSCSTSSASINREVLVFRVVARGLSQKNAMRVVETNFVLDAQ